MKDLIKRAKKKFLRRSYAFSVSDLKEATPEEVYELFTDMADNRGDISESNRLVVVEYIQSQMSPVSKETAEQVKRDCTFTTDYFVPSTKETIKRLDKNRFILSIIVHSISDPKLREGVEKIIVELYPSLIRDLFDCVEICNE